MRDASTSTRYAFFAVAASLLLLTSAHAATPHPLVAHVNRVSDGDTVIATTNEGTKLGIRLLGIDAPELAKGAKPGQPFGEEARDCRAGTAWHDCGD